jgi:membrane-bound lytic murein transglycosylase D
MRIAALVFIVSLLSACAGMGEWSSSYPNAKKDPRLANAPRVDLNKESVSSLTEPSASLWLRIRDGFELPNLDSPLVIQQTGWLAARPDYVHRSLARSSRYLFYIVEEVKQRGMPTELALLPFVESAFNPEAKSVTKAMGIWQFMPATGKDFKLTQNVFRDERRDVLQSTSAALDYLQRLYTQFGDWQLALAAYNWGEGNMARAIRNNQAKKLPTDYLSLKMPNETRNYVPKLMAYRNIISDPSAYGITLPPLENHPYFVAIDVTRDIDVEVAAQLSELPLEEFRNLNPSFNKPVILGAANQQMLLPFGHAELFQSNLAAYDKPLSSWTAVAIPKNETPEQLATRLGVDVAMLREINGIPKGMRIRAGSTVLIPKNPDKVGDIPEHLAENAQLNLEKAAAAKRANSNTTRSQANSKTSAKTTTKVAAKTTANSATKSATDMSHTNTNSPNSTRKKVVVEAKTASTQHKPSSTNLVKSDKNSGN